jgi:hypothetical protein
MSNSLPVSGVRSQSRDLTPRRGNSGNYYYPSRTVARRKPTEAVAGTASSGGKRSVRRRRAPFMWAISLFLLMQIGAVSFIVPQGATDLVRTAGLLVLALSAWQKKDPDQSIDASNRAFQRRNHVVFTKFLAGYLLWALSSTLLHGAIGQFSLHIVGTIFLLVAVRVLSSDGGVVIVRVVPLILGSALAVSAGMGFLDPTQGLEQGRLRGVFVNANLLGFYAFIALIAGLLLVHGKFWSLVLCALSILVGVWTGSRSSAIASLSALLLLALFGNRRSRLIFWVIVGVAAIALVGFIDPSWKLLSRSWGTRDGSFQEAVRVLSVSPLFGLGVGGELVEVASSPLRAFVEGGIAALVGVVIMYLVLLRAALRRNASLVAMSLAAILSSFAEGWFLSAIGSIMLVFTSTWIGVSSRFANCETVPQEGPDRAPTDDGVSASWREMEAAERSRLSRRRDP